MGSKQALLAAELGRTILRHSRKAERFVDLFAGSAAVSRFVTTRLEIPTLSVDLQRFSKVIADDFLLRCMPIDPEVLTKKWIENARAESLLLGLDKTNCQDSLISIHGISLARAECAAAGDGFVTSHYGGHYFSPTQARKLDLLYRSMPEDPAERNLAHAALIRVASRCAASPGHTAQPFQPKASSLRYIAEAWARDPFAEATRAIELLSKSHALSTGTAQVADAISVARDARLSDLVFLDPPYSDAQYSRYYHVLEAFAVGGFDSVYGVGRMPEADKRPNSLFSRKATVFGAMSDLLSTLRESRCTVIMTFPAVGATNGLCGSQLSNFARRMYRVTEKRENLIHSTLGGRNGQRVSRRNVDELVLVLKPR